MLLHVDAMSRLKDILRKKELRKKALVENLSSIRKQLIDLGAIQLILFGSLAQDDVDVHSDLDLLAIMPGPRRGKEWIDEIYCTVKRKTATDIIAYNKSELDEKLVTSSFLKEIVKHGKIIYEKTL